MELTAGVTTELSGAEITLRCLQEEGVEFLFGYPGGAVLPLYDEIFKQEKVKHILVRHEQAAVHAADAYARSTEKVGVVLVTSGPGVTNAVTGIATAYMDSIPVVIISGQVPTHAIGQDAFQEVDAIGVTRPCVKHNFLVKDVKDLAVTMKKAFYLAATGRPGPVLVDIPKDVQTAKTNFFYPHSVSMRSYNPVVKGAQTAARSQVPADLHAWRRRALQRRTGSPAAGPFSGLSLHQHVDGTGRLSGHRSAVRRHARHARHL
jgi:acetolactate synthase-1/2/3 large subunit